MPKTLLEKALETKKVIIIKITVNPIANFNDSEMNELAEAIKDDIYDSQESEIEDVFYEIRTED